MSLIFINMTYILLKGIARTRMKILSSFTRPEDDLNLYDGLSHMEDKKSHLAESNLALES